MKREDVAKVFEGATDEQINAILDMNSADIGKAKGDYDGIKSKLGEANQTIKTITGELQALKDSNATAEDWNRTIKLHSIVLNLVFEYAMRNKLIKENPCKYAEIPQAAKRSEKKVNFYTPKQCYTLLEIIERLLQILCKVKMMQKI